MEYLKGVLDEIFGAQSSHEKDLIIEAVKKDNEEGEKMSGRVAEILPMFNEIFNKRSRVMSKKVINRYKQILKTYSIEDIRKAFTNAKNDQYHTETGYKYCTPEYFSRIEQMDKWESFDPRQKNIFDIKNNFGSPII
jgi:hypothetical protein